MFQRNALVNSSLFAAVAPYAALKALPLGFVDVGARGGIHPLVEPVAALTAVLGFEPDETECQRVRSQAADAGWAVFDMEPIALAETAGTVLLHEVSKPINTSLRPPNRDLVERYHMVGYEPVAATPLQAATLDEVLFGKRGQQTYWGEFLKLDTQGTEYEILRGARRTLAERTVALYLEVEFCQLYEGQKQFSEVELFLRQEGFTFHGFAGVFQRSRKCGPQLDKRREVWRERNIHADAVFFRDPLPGGPQCRPLSERDCHVLFVSALLLGYHDFALELALASWADGAEAQRVENLVRQLAAFTPSQAYHEAMALAERVRARPELANIEVGQFVDERRHLCDYKDVRVA